MRCIRRNQVAGLVTASGALLRMPWRMRMPLFILLFFISLSLSACTYDSKSSAQGTAPAPTAVKQETVAPIPTAMDTFRALAPPEGLRFTPLFNEPVSDTNARIKRLEDAVQTIRNDIDTLVPTMVRMVAIEKDIKGLVAQLQTLTGENGQPVPAQPASDVAPAQPLPAPAAHPPQQSQNKIPGEDVVKGTEPAKALPAVAGPDAPSSLVTPEAAPKGELPPEGAASPNSNAPVDIKPRVNSSASAGDVVNLRIADYADHTRLVIDMTSGPSTPLKLSDDGRTLIIDLSTLNWGGQSVWQADKKKLIVGGRVEEGNLYVDLKQPAKIEKRMLLPPSGNNKNYRLLIDLKGR